MHAYLLLSLYLILLLASTATQTEKPVVKNSSGNTQAGTTQKHKNSRLNPSITRGADTPSTPQSDTGDQYRTCKPENGPYAVKIVSQPNAQDTPAFLVYVGLTAVAMVVNAAILFAMIRQNKLNWRQVRINVRAARAARTGARAATIGADAAQKTVGSISLQLTEMEKAATAAKESADALAGSERAWIAVELTPAGPGAGAMLVNVANRDDPQQQSTGLKCLLICKNHGKTPAWEVKPMMRFEVFDEMPQELNFEDSECFTPFSGPIPAIAPGDNKLCSFSLKAARVMAKGQYGIAYGLVNYMDIFGKQRTTTFCHQVFGTVDIHPIESGGCHKMS
jgi:hypothetical protein